MWMHPDTSCSLSQIEGVLVMPQPDKLLLRESGMHCMDVSHLSLIVSCRHIDSSSDGNPSSYHPRSEYGERGEYSWLSSSDRERASSD